MGHPAFPARRTRLAIITLAVASCLYYLFFILAGWPDRLFVTGFWAAGGTAAFGVYARRHGDRQWRIPYFIGIVGALVPLILLSRTPQPLTLGGCIGLAVAAIAWVIRLLALLITRRAAAARITRSARDPEGA